MFTKTEIGLGLAFLLGTQIGCGTVQNIRGQEAQLPQTFLTPGWPEMGGANSPKPYGGVAIDLECAKHLEWPPRVHGWFPGLLVVSAVSDAVLLCALAVDVPLSTIADTLTLPWTSSPGPDVQPGNDSQSVSSPTEEAR